MFDANANMTGAGTRTFTRDSRNRLIAISGTTASFTYDADDRRSTATLGRQRPPAISTTAAMSFRNCPAATPTANLLTGLGIDQRFTRTEGGTASTYLTDNLGSPVALADATGVNQTSYAYDPYGVTTATGAANTNPYQFTGRENDGATDLYFYRARYYKPTWGRFISEDPIRLAGAINLYRYVANNPLQFAVTGAGHAEVTGVNAARDLGLTPTGTAASRPICVDCGQFLQGQGVNPLSALK